VSEQAPSPWDPQPDPPQQPLVPPGAFPPPPGTQYGGFQYGGAPQAASGQYPQYPGMPYPSNYGQYGPGPYGSGMAAYGPPPGTSGMAIASLVLGICGFFCVTPLIGLGLGIGALVQTSKTRQAGRGLAIAGIILSAAWILLAALLIATGHFHFTEGGSGSDPSNGSTQGPNGTSA